MQAFPNTPLPKVPTNEGIFPGSKLLIIVAPSPRGWAFKSMGDTISRFLGLGYEVFVWDNPGQIHSVMVVHCSFGDTGGSRTIVDSDFDCAEIAIQ